MPNLAEDQECMDDFFETHHYGCVEDVSQAHDADFAEAQHPRGQPANSGQFSEVASAHEQSSVAHGTKAAGHLVQAAATAATPAISDAHWNAHLAHTTAQTAHLHAANAHKDGKPDAHAFSHLAIAASETAKPLSQALKSDQEIEQDFETKIKSSFPAAVSEYNTRPDSENGKIINTDTARELSPDYLKDRTKSKAVHEPASQFCKDLYAQKLLEAPKPGERPLVLFTAGGTGAGKSSAIQASPDITAAKNAAQIIYDTNMNGYESSKLKIEQALQAGKLASVVLVARDPADALVHGALPRAERQRHEFGTGRTVPLAEHIKTHLGALASIKQLIVHYADDPRVEFHVFDNSYGKGNAKQMPLAWLSKLAYTNIEERCKTALENEHASGRISDETYRGFRDY